MIKSILIIIKELVVFANFIESKIIKDKIYSFLCAYIMMNDVNEFLPKLYLTYWDNGVA